VRERLIYYGEKQGGGKSKRGVKKKKMTIVEKTCHLTSLKKCCDKEEKRENKGPKGFRNSGVEGRRVKGEGLHIRAPGHEAPVRGRKKKKNRKKFKGE